MAATSKWGQCRNQLTSIFARSRCHSSVAEQQQQETLLWHVPFVLDRRRWTLLALRYVALQTHLSGCEQPLSRVDCAKHVVVNVRNSVDVRQTKFETIRHVTRLGPQAGHRDGECDLALLEVEMESRPRKPANSIS